jgi:P-type conjugative transfer protein TrbG
MRYLRTLLIAGSIAFGFAAQAELVATPLPGDARLVQFEYDQDNTYLILSKPKAVTDIEFGQDEKIQTVAGGDTKFWEMTPTNNRRHLLLKPTYDQIETSMTVITDKRSYQFVLRSTGPGSKWYQRVTWRYGETILLDLRAAEERVVVDAKKAENLVEQKKAQVLGDGVNPEDLVFNYKIEGDAPFRPVSIFNDGKFTWIRLPAKLQEFPALFGEVDGGELVLVNYVVKGDYLLAQRVMDVGVLKLGKYQIRFERSKPSTGFFGFGAN